MVGTRVTYAEYVAIANDSDVKYEYIAGEVIAMAGGTVEHGRLIGRAAALIDRALEGKPCIVLPSDLRIRIRAADRSTYPDLHVVCGEPERDPEDDHAIVNPTVVVEVLSDSTAGLDRSEKFAAYRRLPSLREYVLVSQRERRVEVYRRRENRRWQLDEHLTGDRLRLESLAIELAVDDLYVDLRPNLGGMSMKESKRKRLKAAGWTVGSTDEFLGLSAVESVLVDLRLARPTARG